MRNVIPSRGAALACLLLLSAGAGWAQDWPQWRGPGRDNKVQGFTAPSAWPKELTQKWKITVGTGDASPVLVGDKVYTFTRQGGDEVISCVEAFSGKVLWQDKYATRAVTGAAGSHPGPRATPAVRDGKVCTLGVAGVVSCLDAGTGKVVWRKDTKNYPKFFTASSPMIVEGKCVAFLGTGGNGALTAFDLASGEEKWKWTGAGPGYGSPILLTVDGVKQVVTPTEKSLVGVGLADGKLLWQVAFAPRYNNNTPILDGNTVYFSGAGTGTIALQIEKKDDGFTAKQLWKVSASPTTYNTPVLKDGALYGITGSRRGSGNYFCMDAKNGEVLWTDKKSCGDCGHVLDAGSVLLALSNDSQFVVFKPNKKEAEEVARYKLADSPWAEPIIAGNRVFVKGRESLTLWMIE